MQDRIRQALQSYFEKHRILFWYDQKREWREIFEALNVEGVEKIELANNEFGVKYRVLRQNPKGQFLLYREGAEPALIQNWLLDVQLANGVFRTDQVAVWLAELGLGLPFENLVRAHEEFFKAGKRLEQLKQFLEPDDNESALRLKMLCVCTGADGGFDTVVESLLGELADGKDERLRLTKRSGLDAFLWQQMQRYFGYKTDEPSIADFAIALFKTCYAMGLGGKTGFLSDAPVFFRRWKNNRNCSHAFETLSAGYTEVLGISQDLKKRDFRDLVELDYFEEIDRAIIRNLVHEVSAQTVSFADVSSWIRQRRTSHWFENFHDIYEAILCAAEVQQTITQAITSVSSLTDGVQRYVKSWFRIDQLYRKFIHHMQQASQASLLGELSEQVENLYVNKYLLTVNDAWQANVDKADRWDAPSVTPQRRFFSTHVVPFRRKDQKICVIISDALRYEIAEEFLGKVRSLDRYEAEIAPMLSSLPSYTQLGMASLLPNEEIQIADNDTGTVIVDGQSAQGLINRQKILAFGRAGDRVHACKADDIMGLPGDEARALVRDNDVIYVYHNRIDATGDKTVSEERVFGAAEETLEDLLKLVKKLTGANVSNLIVTADHGFIYQNRPIEESDYSTGEVKGESVLFRDRRFVLGKGLAAHPGFRKFTSEALGLQGDVEVLIPKSINRLRLKGSGSRYVHGGASLQECVVPVVTINKKRQSDLSRVEVDIIGKSNPTISSGQVSVVFYQTTAATEKAHPRSLRVGFYSASGELLSDSHEIPFDIRSENPREREIAVRFLMAKKADEFNGQEITLRLEERHEGTSHYKEYRTARFTLRGRFERDFDF
ncbi:BREX-1 system phosphatase PglZ type A [Mesorhizobium sp. LSJC264A00]|uniref:BREX-1 system phosphatase PglZ type A n=1 Tax=unclassified Mesorhizobium TaxID=325217 RepID=UPI0003CF8357|nr:BREX-1 system phosphatase PglZ type A [Mesorhizobium sp. LSJC264A00]ESX24127.1 alkaline phosphatase [Mesorhizobium sp. LSJC264A00]